MADPSTFDNPVQLADRDIATTQVDKTIQLSSDTTDFSAGAKAVACHGTTVIKTYTAGAEIVIDNGGATRTFVLTLQGADFVSYKGRELDIVYTLWDLGDRDALTKLTIRASKQ